MQGASAGLLSNLTNFAGTYAPGLTSNIPTSVPRDFASNLRENINRRFG